MVGLDMFTPRLASPGAKWRSMQSTAAFSIKATRLGVAYVGDGAALPMTGAVKFSGHEDRCLAMRARLRLSRGTRPAVPVPD